MGSLMELRHRMMMYSTPSTYPLPDGYEQLPYITANGNQAIRTITYVPTQYDEFHIRLNSANGTILSAGNGTYQLVLIGGFTSTGWYYKYFSSGAVEAQTNYTIGDWYDIDIDSNGVLYSNGKSFTSTYEAPLDGTATNLFLFERRNWAQQYNGSVSEFWIKNNGEYKMYMIPCIRTSDQKVGMYDTIGKTFHTSSRGDFIAGT